MKRHIATVCDPSKMYPRSIDIPYMSFGGKWDTGQNFCARSLSDSPSHFARSVQNQISNKKQSISSQYFYYSGTDIFSCVLKR